MFVLFCLIELIYLGAFFGDAPFFAVDFGFDVFLAAGFFVAVDLGFFVVVAFLTFGLATFFVDDAFLTPAGLAGLVFFCFSLCWFFLLLLH